MTDQFLPVRRNGDVPLGVGRNPKSRRRIVNFIDHSSDTAQSGEIQRRLIMGKCARNVFEHLPSTVIQAVHPRYAIQAAFLEMPQQRVHGRSGPGRGLSYRVPDLDDSGSDIAPGQRHFGSVVRHRTRVSGGSLDPAAAEQLHNVKRFIVVKTAHGVLLLPPRSAWLSGTAQ